MIDLYCRSINRTIVENLLVKTHDKSAMDRLTSSKNQIKTQIRMATRMTTVNRSVKTIIIIRHH